MSDVVQLRVDQKTKRAVAKIFDSLGMDLSTGIKIYFSQVLRCGGVPFSLTTNNGFTPEQEKELLVDSDRAIADYRRGKISAHRSWAAAKKSILAE